MKKVLIALMLICGVALFAGLAQAAVYVDTSANMTKNAWDALTSTPPDYATAEDWAEACAYFWGPRAKAQQTAVGDLTQTQIDAATAALPWNIPAAGTPIPPADPMYPIFVERWALNDVAACIFIQGEATRIQGTDATSIYQEVSLGSGPLGDIFKGAVGVNVDDTINPTQVVAPIWSIYEACSDRAALDPTDPLYSTPLQ